MPDLVANGTAGGQGSFTQILHAWFGRFFGWFYTPGLTPTRMLTANPESEVLKTANALESTVSPLQPTQNQPPSDPNNTVSEARDQKSRSVTVKLDFSIGPKCSSEHGCQEDISMDKDFNGVTISDAWSCKKRTAGGAPGISANQFHRNPQFVANISAQDGNQKAVAIVYQLVQKQRESKSQADPFMGLFVYRVPEEEAERTRKFEPSFFNDPTNLPVFFQRFFSSGVCCERFTLEAGDYLFVPCTFNAREESEFLLRLFAKGKIVVVDLV